MCRLLRMTILPEDDDMKELWNILDVNGDKTGRVIERAALLPTRLLFGVVHLPERRLQYSRKVDPLCPGPVLEP